MARIRIGCSGWNYRHWRERFYPKGLPARRWFEFYAAHFDTVEINNSFYRLPKAETFAKWRDHIRPKAAEVSWEEVPWRATLWDAVVEAQGKEKPILLWAMNGHPLACT